MVSLSTPRITECVIEQPQDRAGRFSTEFFERYQRSEPALAELCAEGFRPARYDLIPDKGQKSGALLINVARAAIVDEDALGAALLDVWWQYPTQAEPERRPSRRPFHELPNVLVTPHSSSSTEATATGAG